MGDWFQTLVLSDVPEPLASEARTAALRFLVSQRVIEPEVSDCILGEGEGHAPGPDYSVAIGDVDPLLRDLATNGVSVEAGRVVAVDPQGEAVWNCRVCGAGNETDEDLWNAISQWYDGDDEAAVVCRGCSSQARLKSLEADPPVAVGHVGITFWNWPPLTGAFVNELEQAVGSSIAVVSGKL